MNRTVSRSPVERRKYRVRAKIRGSEQRPRVSVFRSNKYLYAQVIDDAAQKTVASISTLQLIRKGGKEGVKPVELSKEMGRQLAVMLKQLNIEKAVLDRGQYAYKGSIHALAEGLRESGIAI